MNWRYIVGKSFSEFCHSVLSSQIMPLTRVIPVGISYPYDIKRFFRGNKIKTIFDAGANVGQTSLFLNRYFPQANIYAFEPIKTTYETLKNHAVNFNNIKTYNYAFGSEECQKTIRIRENSELNTLVDSSNQSFAQNESLEQVKITTIDNFCHHNHINNIDILKMDVQGYELEVLNGADNYLKNNLVKIIYSEIGFDKSNQECQSFEDLYLFLTKRNFRFSGFYEFFRWGENKRYFGFCNALFVNFNL